MVLGTSIVSIWGRDAQATRMGAETLAEASGGRFVLGLGVSHPHLAEKLRGHTFERPLAAMRDYLAAYHAAVYRGPTADASAARARSGAARADDGPRRDRRGRRLPVPRHGRADRMDARAPRCRGGGLPTHPGGDPAGGPGGDDAHEAARAYLKPYLRTPTYHASWELQGFVPDDWEMPGSDRLVEAMIATGGPVDARGRIDELVAAGADHVAIIPIAPDGGTEHLPTLEALGA